MGTQQDSADQELAKKGQNLEIEGLKQPLTPLQFYSLSLLHRLIAVKNSYQTDPKFEPWLMKAINKAIYATLRDCIEENIGDAAKELLRREHQVN
jgi:hypothetical protein